ncbi:hypothetical protein [Nonomuraea sp. GTA35]
MNSIMGRGRADADCCQHKRRVQGSDQDAGEQGPEQRHGHARHS